MSTKSIYTVTFNNGALSVNVNVDAADPRTGVTSNALTYPSGYNTFSGFTIRELFDQVNYMLNHATEVSAMMSSGLVSSPFDHFMQYGMANGYSINANYNEAYYLTNNPDVAAYVQNGNPLVSGAAQIYPSGALHYVLYGQYDAENSAALATFITANASAAVQALFATASRSSTVAPATLAFTSTVGDTLTATSAGAVISGTDSTINAGDTANGKVAAKSILNVVAGANVAAATYNNISTYNIQATAGLSFDATNADSTVTLINDSSSAGNLLTITNLSSNPALKITSSTGGLTVNYLDTVLTGNTNTVNLSLSGVTAGTVTLSDTVSGFFKTIHINSMGSAANALTSLAGTALVGATTLNIGNVAGDGTKGVTVPVASAVNSIRTINATSKATVTFADATTGSATGGVTATFAAAGSKIGFTGAFSPIANTVTFNGAGNTLALANALATAVSTNLTGFTALDTLEITDGGTPTVNLSYFGSGIKNINLDLVTVGSVFNHVPSNAVFNIGTSSTAPVASSTLTTTQASPSAVNVNVLGGVAGAGHTTTLTLNSATSANLTVGALTTGTSTFAAITAGMLNTLTVSGGNAAMTGIVFSGSLPATVTSFDATASLAPVTLTTGANGGAFKGSLTATNTFTGAAGADYFYGGAAADTFDGKAGLNTYTGHVLGAAQTDVTTYNFTALSAINTITDMNFGTSTTGVDVINLTHTNALGATAYQKGNGVATGAAGAAVTQAYTGAALSLNAATTALVYNGAAITTANLQTLIQGVGALTFTAVQINGDAIPIFYLNATDGYVHAANIIATDTGTTTANDTVTDFLVFTGVTSVANIDVGTSADIFFA